MSEPFIGELKTFGFNFAPRGWALCEGQLLPIAQNTALFSLLGTTFGGDGRTTFALPDLRGRYAVGVGNGPGLSSYRWGQKGGAETHTLTTAQMPQHKHSLNAESALATVPNPTGNMLGGHVGYVPQGSTADIAMHANSVSNTGGNQSFDLRTPYLGLYVSIALTGIYPSRN